jgi:hypothetical protein
MSGAGAGSAAAGDDGARSASSSPGCGEPAPGRGEERRDDALVEEAGEESFPASDPPASWAGQ